MYHRINEVDVSFIPKSSILIECASPYRQALQLYNKYICPSEAPYEINLPFDEIKRLVSFFQNNQNNIHNNEIAQIFDYAIIQISSLIKASFSRFQLTSVCIYLLFYFICYLIFVMEFFRNMQLIIFKDKLQICDSIY